MNETDVYIKKAILNDTTTIVVLNSALFQEDAGQRDPYMNLNWPMQEGQEHFSKFITDENSICLLAGKGEKIIGYLAGYVWDGGSIRPIRIAELESMYIQKNWRSQGVGKQLANEFLKWAKQRGAQRASVTAYSVNTGAIKFYQEIGFEPKSLSLEMAIK